MKKLSILIIIILISLFVTAQEKKAENYGKKLVNWHLKDPKKDKVMGTSLERAYKELLKGMSPKKEIIVAVIDGGVDIFHEDLEGMVWINAKEIPDNGIDDDNNGYVDDVYGWNFIGNNKGENIVNENLEYTRIVKQGDTLHKEYKRAKDMYDKKHKEYVSEKRIIDKFLTDFQSNKAVILKYTGIDVKGTKDLKKVKDVNDEVKSAKGYLSVKFASGLSEDELKSYQENNAKYLDYYLNLDHNPREIVGDNPYDFNDRNYGNNDVKGPRADHGTPVAGVIAAVRNNKKGINGIASHVKIMALRTTPGGDERDKDVALAIIYAVDNGAHIINMSFGKEFSPEKEFVDEAIRYAEKHNVLLVSSAGNSKKNIDKELSYPTNILNDNTRATNWLSVGASNMYADANLVAWFSNYGKENVNIFAPGVDIVSLAPDNTYTKANGTSFSGPVVSGIAALIWSYYPELTPQELISLIVDSAYKLEADFRVRIPGLTKSTKFTELSISGGIINVYNAFELAKKRHGAN